MFKGSGIVRSSGYKGEYGKGHGQRNKRNRQRVALRRRPQRTSKPQEPDFRGYENF